MPYNSSSFERQLAKYKQAQAEKAVGDMPRKKYESYGDDPHKIKSRVNTDRGSIKSYALEPVQIMGEGAQTAPLVRERITPIIVAKAKKPFYQRTWFVLLVLTTLPTLAMPILYKDKWHEMMGMATSIKSSTGVDPLAVSTYTNLWKNRGQNNQAAPVQEDATNTASTPSAIQPEHMAAPTDMTHAVEKAQERAEEITSQGAGYSMQYIEEEAKRLNDAAKKFDQQYKK